MKEIDEMDMLGYFQVRAWKARNEKEKAEPQRRYIDEVWGNVKP